ncbi:hypothetical protein GCM10010279_04990 [Streptomyces mutabilis]|nr:hypothetical protein GCM10010279_04990 [Streptomyces mutabilis]
MRGGVAVLRGRVRRGQGDAVRDDPLDAAQERRVRAVLALGGVPQADLPDGVQQVRLRLLERTASGREAPRDVSAWAAVVASNLAMDWHRARRRQDRLGERLAALRQTEQPSGEDTSLLSLAVARVQTGGGTDDAAGQAASGAQQDGSASGAAPDQEAGLVFGTPRYLACARLVAEGTVTGADPLPGEARHRITLRVTRSYAPAASAPPQASTGPTASIGPRPGTEPVTFLLDDATARLRPGDRVLVGVSRDGTGADTVITGERNIATARTWISASLPESRTLTCD